MHEKMELTGSSPYSTRIEVKTIQARPAEAERLAEYIAETADYARTVAQTGSWHHDEAESWKGGDLDLIGTQFLTIRGGDLVALRPEIRDRGLGKTYLELLLKPEEGEPKTLAVIEGSSIELPRVGRPEFHEVTSIRGLLDYINAHDTK